MAVWTQVGDGVLYTPTPSGGEKRRLRGGS